MIDPKNADHLIVTSFYGSLKQSWDSGKSWEDVWVDSPHVKDTNNMLTTNLYWISGKWFFNSWNAIYSTVDFKTFLTVVDADTVVGKNNVIDAFWTDGTMFYIGLRAGDNDIGKFFLKSLDGGKTWENLSPIVLRAMNKDPLSPGGVNEIKLFRGIVFAYVPSFTADSWYFSIDGGINFKKLASVSGLFIFDNYLLGTNQLGVYRSDDGLSWEMIYKQSLSAGSFAYDKGDKVLYMVNPFKGVFYSRDAGKTWISYTQGFAENDLWDYTYHQLLRMPGSSIVRIYNDQLYLLMNTRFYKRQLAPKETILVLQVGRSTFTADGVSVTLDSPPVIKNGRTLVPIRAIIESLGGTVGWDGVSRKATIVLGGNTIELWIGKSAATVNGVSTPIDSTNATVVPEIINGRTMLPLRFVTENLGATVGWAAATKTITITYTP
jgi:hypothetical protein